MQIQAKHLRLYTLIVISALTSLTGCGNKNDAQTEKKASQVVARVNQDEISIHQINSILSKSGLTALPEEQQKAARKQILDGLVDQQILIQKAIEKKLDRDPIVLSMLEESRRNILAQAYLQKGLGTPAKPTEIEVKEFFEKNPDLFATRKLYRLQEMALQTVLSSEKTAELKKIISQSKNLTEIAQWLRNEKIPTSVNAAVKAAEQLPLAALPAVGQMRDGEIAYFDVGNQPSILQVISTQASPLNLEEARPYIESALTNRRIQEMRLAELKHLRETAKLEYVGEFVQAVTPQPPSSQANSQTKQSLKDADKADGKSPIDQGIKGL